MSQHALQRFPGYWYRFGGIRSSGSERKMLCKTLGDDLEDPMPNVGHMVGHRFSVTS